MMRKFLLFPFIALVLLPETAHGSEASGVLIVGGFKESGECCEGTVELWSPSFQCKFRGPAAPSSRGGTIDGTVDLVGDRVVACGGKYVDSRGEPLTSTPQFTCNQLWLKPRPGKDFRLGVWESGVWRLVRPRSKHTTLVTCSSLQGCDSSLPSKDLLFLGGEYASGQDTSEVMQLAEGGPRELLLISSGAPEQTMMEEGESKETFPFDKSTGGPRQGHCSIRVDERHAVLTGGSVEGESLASVVELNVWQGKAVKMSLPDLNSPREEHACGFYLKDGIKTLIVTGGVFKNRKQGQERLLDSTEVIDLIGAAWRVVSLQPSHRRISPMGATLDNTFYLIGGLNSNKKGRREILSWDPNSENWVEAGELKLGRGGHAVTTVPLEAAKQHCRAEAAAAGSVGFVSTSSASSSFSSLLLPTINLLFVAFEVVF